MERCSQKTGFLVLRDCVVPAVCRCSHCGRPACALHSKLWEGASVCVECLATRGYASHDTADSYDVDRVRYRDGAGSTTDSGSADAASPDGSSGGGGADRGWSESDFAAFDAPAGQGVEGDAGGDADVAGAVAGASAMSDLEAS